MLTVHRTLKPQRPSRAALSAIPGNENIIPASHKTAGNLKNNNNNSNMSATGALNAPPKRSAFGDVSNTARGRALDPNSKEAVKTRVKAASAMLAACEIRPDGKENNASTKAGAFSKGNPNKQLQPAAQIKAAPRNNALTQQKAGNGLAQPPIRNGVTKKITAVYNDRQDNNNNNNNNMGADSEVHLADDLAIVVAKLAKGPRQFKSQPSLRNGQSQQPLRFAQNKLAMEREVSTGDEEETGDIDDNVTEAAYEDAVERLVEECQVDVSRASAQSENMKNHSYNYDYHSTQAVENSRPAKLLPALPITESADRSEDKENHKGQGYLTVRPYQPLGDNTTRNWNAILAPIVDAQAQRELDLAKMYVMQNQTDEEIEEETWDVSMVAEYGEEIFDYMRELEVCLYPSQGLYRALDTN